MKGLGEKCSSGVASSRKSSLTPTPAQVGTAGSAFSSVSLRPDLLHGPKSAIALHPSHLCAGPSPPINERMRAQLWSGRDGKVEE